MDLIVGDVPAGSRRWPALAEHVRPPGAEAERERVTVARFEVAGGRRAAYCTLAARMRPARPRLQSSMKSFVCAPAFPPPP